FRDQAVLHLDRATHRVDDAAELDDAAVASALNDAAVMGGDGRVDQIAAQSGPTGRPELYDLSRTAAYRRALDLKMLQALPCSNFARRAKQARHDAGQMWRRIPYAKTTGGRRAGRDLRKRGGPPYRTTNRSLRQPGWRSRPPRSRQRRRNGRRRFPSRVWRDGRRDRRRDDE